MSALHCPECQWVGTDPELHRTLDKIDEGAAVYVVEESCPDCGHDQLDECELCVECADNGVDELATDDDYCCQCSLRNFDSEQIESFRRDRVTAVTPLLRQE